jgi:putative addiction module component (TIGR02574 family)
MTQAAAAVLADAVRLNEQARAELVAGLLASFDGPADPDAAQAWAQEIERRVAALESGSAASEPWNDARRRIERDILAR